MAASASEIPGLAREASREGDLPPSTHERRRSAGSPALHRADLGGHAAELGAVDGEEEGTTLRPPALSRAAASHARAARERLGDIARLGTQRRGAPALPWAAAARFEQHLLESLDALLAPGDGAFRPLEEAHRFAREVGFPDPERAFALAFVLGCVEGEAPVRAAILALRRAPPETHAAYRDALSLGSNPAVGPAIAALLAGADPPLASLGLEVLRFRRQATFSSSVVLLDHPNGRVCTAAARCLATVAEQGPAAAVLRRVLAADRDATLSLAAAEGLLTLGDAAGLAFLRHKLEVEIGAQALSDDLRVAYLRLLALAGDAGDRELFWSSLEPGPRDAAAVGWFGRADLVEWLLASLEAENDARRSSARRASPFELASVEALHRITGAGLREGAAGAAHDRDPGALAVDAAVWRAFWRDARGRFAPGDRYRFGRPYTPAATLDELAGESLPAVRAEAALELSVVSAGRAWVETGDWVARQRDALAAARERMG